MLLIFGNAYCCDQQCSLKKNINVGDIILTDTWRNEHEQLKTENKPNVERLLNPKWRYISH